MRNSKLSSLRLTSGLNSLSRARKNNLSVHKHKQLHRTRRNRTVKRQKPLAATRPKRLLSAKVVVGPASHGTAVAATAATATTRAPGQPRRKRQRRQSLQRGESLQRHQSPQWCKSRQRRLKLKRIRSRLWWRKQLPSSKRTMT